MPATIINGTQLANAVLDNVAEQVRALGVPLHLAVVCAGDDQGLRAFVDLKCKKAESIGVQVSTYFFDADDEQGARATLQFLAADDVVQGVVAELPFPQGWSSAELLSRIPLAKDIDGISPAWEKEFYTNGSSVVLPPAVRALKHVLEEFDVQLSQLQIAVVGQGALVGRPVSYWLTQQGARVTIIDDATTEPASLARSADVLIAAAGVPKLINDAWVKPGALVVDYGYTYHNGASQGDVDGVSVAPIAGALTPVPGGMGPLVIAAMLENLLTLATR